MRRRAALRTREGGGKRARASARRGDTYGTKAAMPESRYPNGRGRNACTSVRVVITSGCDSPKWTRRARHQLVGGYSPKLMLREAGSGSSRECAKCTFPRRKDLKHVCARAYGRGRVARPALATDRRSRAAPVLGIGFAGERNTAQRTHEHNTHRKMHVHAPSLAFGRCRAANRLKHSSGRRRCRAVCNVTVSNGEQQAGEQE